MPAVRFRKSDIKWISKISLRSESDRFVLARVFVPTNLYSKRIVNHSCVDNDWIEGMSKELTLLHDAPSLSRYVRVMYRSCERSSSLNWKQSPITVAFNDVIIAELHELSKTTIDRVLLLSIRFFIFQHEFWYFAISIRIRKLQELKF